MAETDLETRINDALRTLVWTIRPEMAVEPTRLTPDQLDRIRMMWLASWRGPKPDRRCFPGVVH